MPAGLLFPLIVEDRASAALDKFAGMADRGAASADRLGRSIDEMSAMEQRAVRTAVQHAEAVTAVDRALTETVGSSSAVQRATLGVVSAEDRLTRAMEGGRASTAQLAEAQSGLIGAQERLAAAQNETATATARTVAVQREASGASAGFFGSFGGGGILKTAGELGLLVGGLEAVKKAIDIGKEASAYQQSMTQIQNLTGVSKTQVAALSSTLLNMAGKVAQSPEDLATSAYHAESALRKLGATAPQIYKAVEIAGKGATIGNTDLEDTTNALTATLASGIVPVNQASRAMGELLGIVGSGDMKMSDLNSALSTGLLVTMKTFGVSLKDTGAALAVYGDNNIRGADAATKLRMAVQDIAKPAADADSVLAKVHLTTDQLRGSLEKNGLNGALDLLKTKLTAAGITGKQIGPFLEDAFTKKAGAGLAILLTHMDQFNEAGRQGQKGANNFGQEWDNVTHTASYALKSLGAEAQAEGIRIAQGATPAVAALAHGLAVVLPAAIDIVVSAAHPFISAFKLAGDVLVPVIHFIAPLAGYLKPIAPEIKFVASAALSLWAAFKGYEIAKVVFTTIGIYAKGALLNTVDFATGTVAANARVIASNNAVVASEGELTASTRVAAGSVATSTGGMSLLATGAKGAAVEIAAAALASQGLSNVIGKLSGNNNRVKPGGLVGDLSGSVATANAGKLSTLMHSLGVYYRSASEGAKGAASSTKTFTVAVGTTGTVAKAAAMTVGQLNSALQNLAQTQLGAAQSQDSFKEGILSLTKTIHTNHDELNQNTTAGLANRDALLGMLGQAVSLANAQRKNGDSIKSVTGRLIDNVSQLRSTAAAAGLSKSAVSALIRQMGLTPKDIRSKFEVDTDNASNALNAIITQMHVIGQGVTGQVNITSHYSGGRTNTVVAKAGGGAVVGEGTSTSDSIFAKLSNGEHVWTAAEVMAAGGHAAMKRMRTAALSRKLPAFATGGPVYKVGHGWGYDGDYYAKKKEADAARRDAIHNARAAALNPAAQAAAPPKHLASGVHQLQSGGYSYGGQYYASYTDAAAARLDARHSAAAGVSTATGAYRTAIRSGDVAQIKAAYATLIADARAAGDSKKALDKLSASEKKIVGDMKARAVATAQAAKAQTYLSNLESKAADVRSSVSSAVTGTFDVTTAGASSQLFNDRPAAGVTAGSILAELTKDATKATAFDRLLRKLGKEGLPKNLIDQLALAGPGAYDQAKALSVATPKQLAGIRSEYSQLNAAGKAAGSYTANLLYGSQIDAAKALLNGYSPKHNPHMAAAVKQLADELFGAGKVSGQGLASGLLGQEKAAGDAADKLGRQVAKALKKSLRIASPSKVTRELGQHTGAGFALGLMDSLSGVQSAGQSVADAGTPDSSWTGSGGGTVHNETHHHWNITEADNGMDVHHKVMRRLSLANP